MNRLLWPTRYIFIWIGLVLWLVGCVNLDIQTMLPDKEVQPLKTGETCAYAVIFPFLSGTLTVQEAMRASAQYDPEAHIRIPAMTRVHSLELHQFGFPFYSEACLRVTGE